MQPGGWAAVKEAAGRDVLAADLRCSLFASALQSYKRDSVLRPFPASYARHDCKDFEALLADASKLPNLKELLQSSGDKDVQARDLVSWILSSKVLTIHSAGKSEFKKIQKLTGAPHTPVPVPDFLFEIEYSNPANAKFYETKGERDLIYAFHGSRLENFHSIIHNGLHCHLNKTSLFGEGTYLTSDLSLALIYSPHGLGWQRSLLGPILSCVAVCEVIDHPDVKCQMKKKGPGGKMAGTKAWVFFFLVLEVTSVSGRQTMLTQSVRRVQPGRRTSSIFAKPADSLESPGEWTTWFNIDHPGGQGDYERLDAIHFYYGDRVCARPLRLEARTTDWMPAGSTGQVVHSSPREGFWCLNREQRPGQNCSNYTVRFLCPPACDLTCPMGQVNADCDACMCQDFMLHGAVSLPGGAPASGATVYLLTKKPKPLTKTDSSGRFRIPGLCPDGKSILKITKAKFAPIMLKMPKTSLKAATVNAEFMRAETPYIVMNPETKARRAGQSVSLCCKATGKPSPDKYFWYHNDTLLDPSLYKHESKLVLRNLRQDQAGEYFCKAQSDSGAVKSRVAQLIVIATDETPCNPTPESYLIRLPHDCFQNATNSFYYDVGHCPVKTCAGQQDNGIRCRDAVEHCCGISKTEEREIQCSGYTLPTKVAMECSCQRCTETRSIVRGRVSAADNGEPMRFGHVYLGGNRVSMTGYKGTFTLHVPQNTERLVLTFVDRLQKFVNTTKVLPFNKKGSAVFHEIKMLRKKEPITLEAMDTNIIPLGEMAGEDPMAELEIPSKSFYRQNGEPYTGKVKASVTFLDPRNISTATAAQSDLNFISDEGDTFPLRTYGMFSVDFTDEAISESLNVGKVKVHLDSTQVKMPEHVPTMKLWSLNPDTGLWEEEGDFKFESQRRGKREERTFLVGNMEIRERRLFNLDVPESRRCFIKVRAYRSERFLPSEQIQGVVVSVINLEPRTGFSSNPRAWGRFDSVITGPNGACVPAFCDDESPDAYSAYVLASLAGEELEAVQSFPKFNPNAIGVPQPYLNKLKYRRTDHEDPRVKKTAFQISMAKPRPNSAEESNGPIYAFENLRACEEAPPSAAHFRFYQIEGDRYDYNTVPFNEDDPMSWTEDYLAWWPKPMEFRACYIKVKIVGPVEVNVRSRNMGGTHRRTVGKLYGIRDVKSTRDRDQPNVSSACLEFKCSGMLYDQDRVDRTLVKVIPQGSCHRASVNSMLHEYLVNHLPLAVNNDTSEYTMLAPLDPLGHNYGIYTVTDQDPRVAKEIALGRCFDGTSDGSSRVMKSNVGVALTFNCVERQVGRQSAFQYLQSPSARPPATNSGRGRVPSRRQQRASRRGQRRREAVASPRFLGLASQPRNN
ncbi:cartilage intermediate layer protein 1 isoform X3 [Neovison vison]|uniref:cartilage intermediate layer protein 1 isoform X3 n=1 Tax=Neovison vison TaxID=452646 RepID=UPI001CF0BEA4|nr:cartilage intermediate layer protein 1 isoform X3 [Neogale vison]